MASSVSALRGATQASVRGVAPRAFSSQRPSRVAHGSKQAAWRQTSRRLNISCAAATEEAVEVPTKRYHPSPLSQPAPSTYAVVEIGGHQMFVEPGKWYTCNRLKAEVGAKIKFGRVLAVKQDGDMTLGRPYLEGATVEAEIVEELRGPKLIVFKMKKKKHYRRKNGHRQDLTKFLVTKVSM